MRNVDIANLIISKLPNGDYTAKDIRKICTDYQNLYSNLNTNIVFNCLIRRLNKSENLYTKK